MLHTHPAHGSNLWSAVLSVNDRKIELGQQYYYHETMPFLLGAKALMKDIIKIWISDGQQLLQKPHEPNVPGRYYIVYLLFLSLIIWGIG